MTALTDADQDAGLREDLAETVLDTLIDWMVITPGTTQTTETVDEVADALLAGPLAILRARATAAEDKLRDREAEVERLREKAEDQFRFWQERVRRSRCFEDCISEDGETYTPLGDDDAYDFGYGSGRFAEADWWRQTIAALASTEQPASSEEASR